MYIAGPDTHLFFEVLKGCGWESILFVVSFIVFFETNTATQSAACLSADRPFRHKEKNKRPLIFFPLRRRSFCGIKQNLNARWQILLDSIGNYSAQDPSAYRPQDQGISAEGRYHLTMFTQYGTLIMGGERHGKHDFYERAEASIGKCAKVYP